MNEIPVLSIEKLCSDRNYLFFLSMIRTPRFMLQTSESTTTVGLGNKALCPNPHALEVSTLALLRSSPLQEVRSQ